MAAGRRSVSQQEVRKRRKMIIFVIEIAVILIMLGVLWKLVAHGDSSEGPARIEPFKPEEVGVNDKFIVKEENNEVSSTLQKRGYLNIALFGVDATTTNQLYGGSRSDTIMIASVNLDTGDIKLVSVYRDTLLDVIDDKPKSVTKNTSKATSEPSPAPTPRNAAAEAYRKCNSAYAYGGAQQALTVLNMNLDLDISTFVTVGYRGLSEVVDGVGGVWIDIDSDELEHINNYQIDIAKVLKCEYTPVTATGYQKLNGVQAAAYCRIRYTTGNDFMRTSRQREVLKAIEKEAKNIKDWEKLWNIFTKCSDDIYTNVSNDQILELMKNITKYSIVDEDGFPQADMRTVANIDVLRKREIGSAVIPIRLEDNVVWLHKFLFGDTSYTVSKTVSDISKTIETETAPFLQQ